MKDRSAPKPTDAELAILRVLWEKGPSTVRSVWETINANQRTGSTTTLKLMQIMFEKGLLRRNEAQRSHIYEPAFRQEETQRQVVGHLLSRVFGGSAAQLVLQALSVKKASPADLAEIRRLLDEKEGGKK